MGTIYQALAPQVNRLIALKIIPFVDPVLRTHFQREVLWTAGRLIHPHIVTLFDVGD